MPNEALAAELSDTIGVTYEVDAAVAEHFRVYIKLDIAAFARDLEYGGDIMTVEHGGRVWVFEA